MGNVAVAALIGVISLLVGLVFSISGQFVAQFFAGRQTLHRER